MKITTAVFYGILRPARAGLRMTPEKEIVSSPAASRNDNLLCFLFSYPWFFLKISRGFGHPSSEFFYLSGFNDFFFAGVKRMASGTNFHFYFRQG